MNTRVQITFTREEKERLEKEAARLEIPVAQFCKDIILSTDFSKLRANNGNFAKNYAVLVSEIKNYVKHHTGTFQLKDLSSWQNIWQKTFDDDLIPPESQRRALGKALAKDVEMGRIPGLRIALTRKDGEVMPLTKNKTIIYEIIPETPEHSYDKDWIYDEN